VLPCEDHLAGSPILIAPQLDEGRIEGKIFLAAPIDGHDLRIYHPGLFTAHNRIWWDTSSKRVQAVSETRLNRIVISEISLRYPDQQQILSSFLTGIREEGIERLPWNDNARQFQARIGSLQHWQGHGWPDISDTALLADLTWLTPYCLGMTTALELKQLDITTILQSLLSREQLLQLDRDVPTHITVPSGSRVMLHYEPGKQPVLAVRLQELF
jgi:ATP-dependent helicase HrpB